MEGRVLGNLNECRVDPKTLITLKGQIMKFDFIWRDPGCSCILPLIFQPNVEYFRTEDSGTL